MTLLKVDAKFHTVDGTNYTVTNSDDGGDLALTDQVLTGVATTKLESTATLYKGLNSIRNIVPNTTVDKVRNRYSFATSATAVSAQFIYKPNSSTITQEICTIANAAGSGATSLLLINTGTVRRIQLKDKSGAVVTSSTGLTNGSKYRFCYFVTRGTTTSNGRGDIVIYTIDPSNDDTETLFYSAGITGNFDTADMALFWFGSNSVGYTVDSEYTGVRLEDGVAHEIGTASYGVDATVNHVVATAAGLIPAPVILGYSVVSGSGPALATAQSTAPAVRGGLLLVGVAATATGGSTAPVVTAAAKVVQVIATATGASTAPVVLGVAIVVAPAAVAGASSAAPNVAVNVSTTSVVATASGASVAPVVLGGATVVQTAATGADLLTPPVIRAGWTVVSVAATATGSAVGPSTLIQAFVNAPAATALGDPAGPAVTGNQVVGATINPPAATATGTAPSSITAIGKAYVIAVAATATGIAPAPTSVIAAAFATSVAATASGASVAPVVKGPALVLAVAATGSGTTVAPAVSGAVFATVAAARADGSGQAIVPVIIAGVALAAPAATTSISTVAPYVAGGARVVATVADATIDTGIPDVWGGATVDVDGAVAAGSAIGPAVSAIEAPIVIVMPATANANDGSPLVLTVGGSPLVANPRASWSTLPGPEASWAYRL